MHDVIYAAILSQFVSGGGDFKVELGGANFLYHTDFALSKFYLSIWKHNNI